MQHRACSIEHAAIESGIEIDVRSRKPGDDIARAAELKGTKRLPLAPWIDTDQTFPDEHLEAVVTSRLKKEIGDFG